MYTTEDFKKSEYIKIKIKKINEAKKKVDEREDPDLQTFYLLLGYVLTVIFGVIAISINNMDNPKFSFLNTGLYSVIYPYVFIYIFCLLFGIKTKEGKNCFSIIVIFNLFNNIRLEKKYNKMLEESTQIFELYKEVKDIDRIFGVKKIYNDKQDISFVLLKNILENMDDLALNTELNAIMVLINEECNNEQVEYLKGVLSNKLKQPVNILFEKRFF